MITCFAPGRVELLGNHTDYNEGFVLSVSIPYGVTASGSLLPGGQIRLSTEFQGNRLEHVAAIDAPFVRRNDWTDYPLGVVHALREAGHVLGGFEVSFSSDLPPGAGLSSSAAMEVSTVLLLAKLFGFTMSGIEFAKLCRLAENQFVGVQCGILDQVSSLFGKKDRAVSLDCRSLDVDTITFPHGVKLLIIQSGVPHALVGGEYNERRERCSAAARALGVPFLRDADSAMLAAGNLPEPERRRAAHIIGENERVRETIKLLSRGDVSAVGQLMSASHESSRVNFENSTPVLDMLVDIAKSTPGVLGARLTGGGFGGAIVVLVERDASHGAGEAIAGEYFRRSGNHAAVLECDLSDGALALNGFGII